MPFRSEAQRRFMFSQHPDIARRWVAEGKGGIMKKAKKIVKKMKTVKKKKPTVKMTRVVSVKKPMYKKAPSKAKSVKKK